MMAASITQTLAEIRARLDAATKGPWSFNDPMVGDGIWIYAKNSEGFAKAAQGFTPNGKLTYPEQWRST